MTKAELVVEISQKSNLNKDEILSVIEHLMRIIKDSLENNENVYLRGFGSFIVVKRNEKRFHAAPGKYITIPEHYTPVFKPCRSFKQKVNK